MSQQTADRSLPAFKAWTISGLILACLSNSLAADEWPDRAIRAVVPLSAGSAVDIIPRIVFEQLSTQLGRSIVVENRSGASGTIGARAVASAPADGYTLLAHSAGFAVAPSTVANAGYDPVKDFVPVAPLGTLPNVLVISPSKNIKTVHQLVATAKSRQITFSSVGAGSPVHLTMERFRFSAGFEGQHIPFRGAQEALLEVITGRVDVYYSPILAALESIRSGALIPLAVSSAKRSAVLPDVPTSLEAGFANSDSDFWIGVFAPAGTPGALVEKLNREIAVALKNQTVREKLAKLGVDPIILGTGEFKKYVSDEVAAYATLVAKLGLAPQ